MMFHTNDSAEVEMRRKWMGTKIIVTARAGIQKVHEVKMVRGIKVVNSERGTPISSVRQQTIVAVKIGEKMPWSSINLGNVPIDILATLLNHTNKMGVIHRLDTNAATITSRQSVSSMSAIH